MFSEHLKHGKYYFRHLQSDLRVQKHCVLRSFNEGQSVDRVRKSFKKSISLPKKVEYIFVELEKICFHGVEKKIGIAFV